MSARGHGTTHGTLRWGDVQEVVGLEATFSDAARTFPTVQLNQAHWEWPLTWCWWLALVPNMAKAETGTFKVRVDVTLGVGQAQATFPLFYALAPTGGIYLPVTDQRFFPAQDLQLRAIVSGAASQNAPDGVTISSFLAPQTEPHAMTHMLDHVEGKGGDQVEWMQSPFQEQPLRYRGGR